MRRFIISLILLSILSSCTKEFLEVKPDKKLTIPQSLDDLDKMLNNPIFYTGASNILGVASCDDFFVKDSDFALINSGYAKNSYTFEPDIFENEDSGDWNQAYQRIIYSNVILGSIDTIKVNDKNKVKYNEIKGEALFHRAANHYQLTQLFCPEYDETSASNSICIPIKNDYDISVKPHQGTVKELYDFILQDIKLAIDLLPEKNSIYRPSKPAAHLLMARAYLHMEKYDLANQHAKMGLSFKSDLFDINHLDSNLTNVFPVNLEQNPEIILNHESQANPATLSLSRINISNDLINLYEENDLRRIMYFRVHTNGNKVFRGCYKPSNTIWGGYSTNELWLISAETNIRLGKKAEALKDLNRLLSSRYRKGTFNPYHSDDDLSVLNRILQERRKDLLFTGTRWEDLKRLNKDPRFNKELKRVINGQSYTLPINSNRWIFPFPKIEIDLYGWKQYNRN